MLCDKLYSLLNRTALQYSNLGYQIGLTKNKVLVTEHYPAYANKNDWDSISIILNSLVCVDLDHFTSLGKDCPLPQTLKERSPRGLHFFYRLSRGFEGVAKIGWKPKVDLLTKAPNTIYHKPDKLWEGHVLCSPSKGYSRLFPRNIPPKNELPMAPDWLIKQLTSL